MKFPFSPAVLALPLALLFAAAPMGAAVAQEGDCVNASQAQRLVESGELLNLPEALARAGKDNVKLIGSQARLCNVSGTPHWVMSVMNSYGESERIVLNAQAGSQ